MEQMLEISPEQEYLDLKRQKEELQNQMKLGDYSPAGRSRDQARINQIDTRIQELIDEKTQENK